MGIYINEWLEYVLVIDINESNKEQILKVLKTIFDFPCVKTKGKHTYISIDEYDDERLLKTKYYDERKEYWGVYFKENLIKVEDKYLDELILGEKNKIMLDKLLCSDLKDYVVESGWYKNSSMGTTYGDDPLGRHYLQYIVELNVEDNFDSIDSFKNKLKKICELNKIRIVPQLYRQKTNNMIFIKIRELTGQELYDTEYYKHYYLLWNLEKDSVNRKAIMDDTGIELKKYDSDLLNVLLSSEISLNIIRHGWYDVYD